MEMAAAAPSSWEDLPPDLLGLVLLRLPSLVDRVHLRAVCRPWRAGAHAKRQPVLPPPLPWLAFRDGGLVDLHGARVRCAPILREGVDFGYLVVDNLAFLVHNDGACSVMNPLSGSTLPLPKLAPAVRCALDESEFYNQSYIRKTHEKVILSSPLDSTLDPLVATLIMEGNGIAVSTCKQHDAITISLGPDPDCPRVLLKIEDIAFLHGKLYALTPKEGLHVIELDAGRLSELKSSSGFLQCIAEDPKQQQIYSYRAGTGPAYVMRYLAESNGRLLMMRRWMSYLQNARLGDHNRNDRTVRFEVFMADLTTLPGRWTKVDSLDGQAIFLGSECSQSVLASQCAGGVQKDCIYYMDRVFDYNPSKEYFGPCVDPLGNSGVYNMRDGEITPLLPEATMTELRHKRQFATWFFPADA
uniref:KIB1-4 beta-propeller domain-containing protein n=1 Tax=Arundo donax TaxID=35708 RepID=A0A0A8ZG24_ARUDO